MLQYLTAELEDETLLYFSKEVWNLIHKYKQKGLFKKEQGGIFLGKERNDSLEIIEATTPQKGDICNRFSFHRNSKHHQKIATEKWLKSDSTKTYCGEWHTHPQKIAIYLQVKTIGQWQNKLSGYFITSSSSSNWN